MVIQGVGSRINSLSNSSRRLMKRMKPHSNRLREWSNFIGEKRRASATEPRQLPSATEPLPWLQGRELMQEHDQVHNSIAQPAKCGNKVSTIECTLATQTQSPELAKCVQYGMTKHRSRNVYFHLTRDTSDIMTQNSSVLMQE